MKKKIFFKDSRKDGFISGILIFMLVFGSLLASVLPVRADPLATISAGNITLEQNSYGVMGVFAENILSPGLAGYVLDINYDPSKISIVGITRSASFSPPTPTFGGNEPNPSSTPGNLTVAYASSYGKQGSFKLFNVKFKALQTLTEVSPFTVTVKEFAGPYDVDPAPTLSVTEIADEPNVSADDQNNLIVGLAVGMEYSIDGSEFTPFSASNLPTLSGDHTVFVRLSAIAGASPSGAERMLTFTEAVSIPQALVGSTTYNSDSTNYIAHGAAIHLKSATLGVTFYYTKGEQGNAPGNPSSADETYVDAAGITIEDGKTIIKVIAVKEGMDDSSIATFTFINKVSTPYVVVNGIQYHYAGTSTAFSVTQGTPVFLESSTGNVSLYYTTDGTTPTTASTLYSPTTGITNLPSGTTTLKVLGTKDSLADSWTPSFLVTVSQLISAAPTVAQISVINNLTGTDDTVTVHDVHGGGIVKVYADASTETALGWGMLPTEEITGSVTVTIPQLGTTAGTVYVSITSPGKSESPRTRIDYAAEDQTTAPAILIVVPTPTSQTSGKSTNVSIAVTTVGISNGTAITVELINSDGSSLSLGISGSSTVQNDSATVTLNVPISVASGSYKLKVVSSGIINNSTDYNVLPKFGDVNNTGDVNITDALQVLKAITNPSLFNSTQRIVADVNGDGSVNITDALLILKHITNPVPFPIES